MVEDNITGTDLEDYFCITEAPRCIRLKGHDLGLEEVVKRYRLGFSVEQMRQEFPPVSLEQVYAAITYYLHNKPDIDAYVASREDHSPIAISRSVSAAEKLTAVIRMHASEWESK